MRTTYKLLDARTKIQGIKALPTLERPLPWFARKKACRSHLLASSILKVAFFAGQQLEPLAQGGPAAPGGKGPDP